MREEGRLLQDGAYVQYLTNNGPIANNLRRFPSAFKEEVTA